MPITALPTPPSRDDPANFSSRADAFLGALPAFGTEANALASDVTTKQSTASTAATTATTKAAEALVSANNALASETASELAAVQAVAAVEKYLGSSATDPTVNKTGGALTAGDWYVNSATGFVRAYNGTAWVQGISAVAGVTSINGSNGAVTLKTIGGINLTGSGDIPYQAVGDLITTMNTLSAPSYLPCGGQTYLASSYPSLVGKINYAHISPTITSSTMSHTGWRIVKGATNFVAMEGIAASTKVSTSPDGTTWTVRTLPSAQNWSELAYGNGLFVICGINASNIFATSPDGITWTQRTLPVTPPGASYIKYGGGIFVIVCNGSIAFSSPDGITWTQRSITSAGWSGVGYGNGMFIAVVSGGVTTAYSYDGITWNTGGTLPVPSSWSSVSYGNGMFLIGSGAAGAFYCTSNDGLKWTQQSSLPSAAQRDFSYGNGMFFAVEYGTTNINYSTDGLTWSSLSTGMSSNYIDSVYSGDAFYFVSYNNSNVFRFIFADTTKLQTPLIVNSKTNAITYIKAQ